MFLSTKQLTKNFHYEEFFKSITAIEKGIHNYPDLANYCLVACNVLRLSFLLQRIRDIIQMPVTITSGFRCSALNSAVAGAADSRHLYGAAVDIKCNELDKLLSICRKFEKELSPDDNFRLSNVLILNRKRCIKVIKEPTWVHLQLELPGAQMNIEDFYQLVNSVIIK